MNLSSKGKFIVFEGIDGSGKSTQIERLKSHLDQRAIRACSTFEPTDGAVGKLIRQMLAGDLPCDQRTIAMLFAADRSDHLFNAENGLCRMVDEGCVVLCDRYYFSSYAYHSQYVDMEWVIASNIENAKALKPDMTLFIDVDPKVCFERIKSRGEHLEMYEKIDIMKQVRHNYFLAFERLEKEEKVVIINGNQPMEKVEADILEKVSQVLNL